MSSISADVNAESTINSSDRHNVNNQDTSKASKRKLPPKFLRSKRPRFTSPNLSVSYQQNSLPKSIMSTPNFTPFRIQANTNGLRTLVRTIYDVLIIRDRKLESTASYESLMYCASLATIYRFLTIGQHTGLFDFPTDYSLLKQYALAIVLPEPICRYIESIGHVDVSSGITVAPFIPTLKEFISDPRYFDDLPAVHAAALQQPSVLPLAPPQGHDYDDTFSRLLEGDIIYNYLSGITRGYKANVNFRKCDFEVMTGKPEFLASYHDDGARRYGHAPCMMEEITVRTGAAYGFRNETNRNEWSGQAMCLPDLHMIGAFDLKTFIVSHLCSGAGVFTH